MLVIANDKLELIAGGQVSDPLGDSGRSHSTPVGFEVGATGDSGTGYTGSYSNPTGTSLDGYDIYEMNETQAQREADHSCSNGIFGGIIAGAAGGVVGMGLGALGGGIAGGCLNK